MRYFFMKQDISLPCAISYRDFDITGGSHVFTKEDAERLNNSVVLYLLGNGKEAKWDFLQRPVTMFSQRFQAVPRLQRKDYVF